MLSYRSLFGLTFACGAVLLLLAGTADAQSPTANPYRARSIQQPSVSPYLNLNVDSNGISNYATLVRPLLNQREMQERQRVEEQLRARPQLAQGRATRQMAAEEPNPTRPAGSFMNYSHYFGARR